VIRLISIIALLVLPSQVDAQTLELSQFLPAGDDSFSGRIIQGVIVLTLLSVAPGILVTTTCFTRFIIAFSFLRSGLGLQSTPSNLIVISLALFMTYFAMSPVFEKSWNEGVKPLLDNKLSQDAAIPKILDPIKNFMLNHVREEDLDMLEIGRASCRERV